MSIHLSDSGIRYKWLSFGFRSYAKVDFESQHWRHPIVLKKFGFPWSAGMDVDRHAVHRHPFVKGVKNRIVEWPTANIGPNACAFKT